MVALAQCKPSLREHHAPLPSTIIVLHCSKHAMAHPHVSAQRVEPAPCLFVILSKSAAGI
eukprot:COSAG05_NODE_8175_length_729_cov_0.984127_2_plen_59_part_01